MFAVPGVPSRPLQYLKSVANSDLSPGTRATCWALASFADNDSGQAFPTVATLAKATGLSKETVSKHTKLAEAAGYLHKHVRRNNSILYTITTPITDDMITKLDAETSWDTPDSNAGPMGWDEHSAP